MEILKILRETLSAMIIISYRTRIQDRPVGVNVDSSLKMTVSWQCFK